MNALSRNVPEKALVSIMRRTTRLMMCRVVGSDAFMSYIHETNMNISFRMSGAAYEEGHGDSDHDVGYGRAY
jgi:hypothetical protein